MKVIKFDERAGAIIANGLKNPLKKTKNYFDQLGLKVDQQTQLTFKVLGARQGHKKWIGFNRGRGTSYMGSTTRTKAGSWNIRRGTDNSRTRRYGAGSKLLQASGGFRQSWKILKTTKNRLLYGSTMKIAKLIMSGRKAPRPVLFVMNKDRKDIGTSFKNFYLRGIKF